MDPSASSGTPPQDIASDHAEGQAERVVLYKKTC